MTNLHPTKLPVLNASANGTPLFVVHKKNYPSWLEEQNSFTKNWIKSTGYKGDGLVVIPNANGELDKALLSTDTDDQFCAGELYNLLPEGEFNALSDSKSVLEKVAFGFLLGGYQFSKFKSKDKTSKAVTLNIDDADIVSVAKTYAQSVFITRDLINTPADSMMPEHLAATSNALATEYGGACRQIVGEDLLDENYPTIYTVGRASSHPSQLIDLHWGSVNNPKVTLIGKGVCFDSGGLDIKPSSAMRFMKKDMGGAAHVLGLANLIMAAKLPIHLRVMVPAVENAVSGNAFRPGDVITTRKGITVEIDNTDAEGRLVLCDALAEANNDQPELIIDFATLTGACRVALGTELPGMFSTSSNVANGIKEAGENCGDPVWELPLHKPYKALLNSEVADITNCATSPFGGAITAALFLQEFVDENIDWVHFDVMAWNNRKLPGRPTGGEAMGIRAVFEYLKARFQP